VAGMGGGGEYRQGEAQRVDNEGCGGSRSRGRIPACFGRRRQVRFGNFLPSAACSMRGMLCIAGPGCLGSVLACSPSKSNKMVWAATYVNRVCMENIYSLPKTLYVGCTYGYIV
jgi:hypothetical protein